MITALEFPLHSSENLSYLPFLSLQFYVPNFSTMKLVLLTKNNWIKIQYFGGNYLSIPR